MIGKAIQVLVGKIKDCLHDIGFSKDFSNKTWKLLTLKGKYEPLEYFNVKNYFSLINHY